MGGGLLDVSHIEMNNFPVCVILEVVVPSSDSGIAQRIYSYCVTGAGGKDTSHELLSLQPVTR